MMTWLRARWRSALLIATPVLVTSALLTGGALAQTPPDTNTITIMQGVPAPVSSFISKVAARLGIGEEDLTNAMKDARKEMIDEEVAAGRLPQEAAARMKERVDAGHILAPGLARGKGAGPHGPGPKARVVGLLRADLNALAQWMGMTPPELMEELRAGHSLAQVAEARGKTRQELITVLTEHMTQHLNKAVAEGEMTREQADQRLENFKQQADTLVDQQMPMPGSRGPFPRGKHGGNA